MIFLKEFATQIIGQFNLSQSISRNKVLLEKASNVFEYLAQVRKLGYNPLFRGGSALQLIHPKGMTRFSIDLDIAFGTDPAQIDQIVNTISELFGKEVYNFEKRKVARDSKLPTMHYENFFPTNTIGSGSFLLDVALYEVRYASQRVKLSVPFYHSDVDVKVPTVNSIFGDKLTTLALNTMGLSREKDSLLHAKQVYDLHTTFPYLTNFEELYQAYLTCYEDQKKFRGKDWPFDTVLDDLLYYAKILTLDKSLLLGPLQEIESSIKSDFSAISDGIFRLSSHLMGESKFTARMARVTGGEIAFIAKLMRLFRQGNVGIDEANEILREYPSQFLEKIKDKKFVERTANEIAELPAKDRWFIYLPEIKGGSPLALLYWEKCLKGFKK